MNKASNKQYCIASPPLFFMIFADTINIISLIALLALLALGIRLIVRVFQKKPLYDLSTRVGLALLAAVIILNAISDTFNYSNYYLGFLALAIALATVVFALFKITGKQKVLYFLIIPALSLVVAIVSFFGIAAQKKSETKKSVRTLDSVERSLPSLGCGASSTF